MTRRRDKNNYRLRGQKVSVYTIDSHWQYENKVQGASTKDRPKVGDVDTYVQCGLETTSQVLYSFTIWMDVDVKIRLFPNSALPQTLEY